MAVCQKFSQTIDSQNKNHSLYDAVIPPVYTLAELHAATPPQPDPPPPPPGLLGGVVEPPPMLFLMLSHLLDG